tara:strand:+ start:174 stop:746 length:573 start_codon:yes stop_codon:yes gene_type:complete
MFLDPHINPSLAKGHIEVICGSMFSGKTEELLRRLKRAKFAKLKTAVFKPMLDVRYDAQQVVSHDLNTTNSAPVESPYEILTLVKGCDVVAIDEAQFFSEDLVDVCNQLANQGKRVIVAGLDMDFLGNPFGAVPKILAIAEHVTKVHAVCTNCGKIANYSFRLSKNKDLVKLGQKEEYKPLCRQCFVKNI